MATRIKLEFECDNGHWVGVMDDDARVDAAHPSGNGKLVKIVMPTHCPHPSCGTKLSPWVRRRKAAS